MSDGFGFFIRPALEALGVGELPVVTARTTFADRGASIAFPNGHPACHVCGTCKRNRVLAHQAAGRAVVFIGDGESDRYAAGYADVVFAKHSLINICLEAGWSFRRWTEFAEIDALAGRASLHAWAADDGSLAGPAARPVFCGPEVWGKGLVDPPEGYWPPSGRDGGREPARLPRRSPDPFPTPRAVHPARTSGTPAARPTSHSMTDIVT